MLFEASAILTRNDLHVSAEPFVNNEVRGLRRKRDGLQARYESWPFFKGVALVSKKDMM